MTKNCILPTPPPKTAAGNQGISEKSDPSPHLNGEPELLSGLHRQIGHWIENCDDMWLEHEVAEDLALIQIMIKSWQKTHPHHTRNGRVH